mgnify:FL=1
MVFRQLTLQKAPNSAGVNLNNLKYMIKVKLKNRTYKIPESFTIDQWKAISKMDMEDPLNWPKIMGIGMGLPVGKFINATQESLILGASLVINAMGTRKPAPHADFTKLTSYSLLYFF